MRGPMHIEWWRRPDDPVAWLWLNRPPLNILHIAMLEEIDAALAASATDHGIKAIVVGAAEGCRAFSAGVDVADHTANRVASMLTVFHRACLRLRDAAVPTIAFVDGAALGGGCELALACDLVVATPRARFGQPEIKLAAFAPVASVLLAEAIGTKRAADWLLTGRTLTAEDAAAAGLVSRLLPDVDPKPALDALVAELTASSGAALRLAKRALRIGAAGDDTAARLTRAERLYLDDLMATEDVHEGLAAFAGRRPAAWRDR
ncbi:enoyl-CoA hydratase [bacterium]|nr:enoyl-CoA hydratase/isomerase family protein [Chloroflexi bacterium CFX6]RIL12465.1 MAG: enoyl-CoA hydratase [bacterium]